jgi:hypothetical protein
VRDPTLTFITEVSTMHPSEHIIFLIDKSSKEKLEASTWMIECYNLDSYLAYFILHILQEKLEFSTYINGP